MKGALDTRTRELLHVILCCQQCIKQYLIETVKYIVMVEWGDALVGIVLVSHSKKMAEGAMEIIQQVIGDKIKISVAAGTSDNRLGTDVFLIEQKVLDVFDGDGVLIIPDLGSAVMSAEMAIESLEEPAKSVTQLADAPFFEG
ncbi:MAG: dihydroxyacetone kinase phosphoryl donor subunit DhaM, partial [Tepidanaerobacteraceae bacterium]|nr:dihydroxyacetone kinase phosphoryl donor subunit DhaM [Tepidanaerobacteraceae bacterium]